MVQHRGNTVKTEAVKMVFVQPEFYIGQEKMENLGLIVIKNL